MIVVWSKLYVMMAVFLIVIISWIKFDKVTYPYPVLNLIKDKIPILGLDIVEHMSSCDIVMKWNEIQCFSGINWDLEFGLMLVKTLDGGNIMGAESRKRAERPRYLASLAQINSPRCHVTVSVGTFGQTCSSVYCARIIEALDSILINSFYCFWIQLSNWFSVFIIKKNTKWIDTDMWEQIAKHDFVGIGWGTDLNFLHYWLWIFVSLAFTTNLKTRI